MRPGTRRCDRVARRRGGGTRCRPYDSVVVPTAQREVVDPEHPRGWCLRVWKSADQAQQGHPADRRGQALGQPRAWSPAQRQRDRTQHTIQNRGAAGVAQREPGQRLGEGPSSTRAVVAEQPADPHLQQHLAGADRGVGQPPHVPAVHPPGLRPAPRTGHRPGPGAGLEPHHHHTCANTLDAQPGQVREQHSGHVKIRTLEP